MTLNKVCIIFIEFNLKKISIVINISRKLRECKNDYKNKQARFIIGSHMYVMLVTRSIVSVG